MIQALKQRLYFLTAWYFRFWATLQLKRWSPQIIVVTGSSGKTTTMHLIESQLGDTARYSHHANSAFGICFDILGLSRKTLLKTEWFGLFALAPLRALKRPYKQHIYIAEVDCDRPKEGRFLASMLRPNGAIWLSSGQTHSMNFQDQVAAGQFDNVEAAISHEFGYLIQAARDFVVVNNDNTDITNQLSRTKARIYQLSLADCSSYEVSASGTEMKSAEGMYSLSQLVPKEVFFSVQASEIACKELGVQFDNRFGGFELPPGRSSLFRGIKDTTIIDSSYNSSADALAAMLELFKQFKAPKKWLVVGDVLEQGNRESAVHKAIAQQLVAVKPKQIVLVGPRVAKYTYPELQKLKLSSGAVVVFEQPKDALHFISQNLAGGEAVLFKGARFLEGVIEHLLADSADVDKLCRRELSWQRRREQWGL